MGLGDTYFNTPNPPDQGQADAVRELRRYLDEIHYHGIYQYLLSAGVYYSFSSAFSAGKNRLAFDSFELGIHGDPIDWKLAACLTAHTPCRMSGLSLQEQRLAQTLAKAGLASVEQEIFQPDSLQLLSVNHDYLLVDAAIHYPMTRLHKIYFGMDTMMLLYYLNSLSGRMWESGLDLCSGSGVLGLAMARMAGRVVSTDIAAEPLRLIPLNLVMNGRENAVELRKEALSETLKREEVYDLITCNPPFVALPEGYGGTIYAKGTQRDGLGYMRDLFDAVPSRLSEEGAALFVADFPGDHYRPHFFEELKQICVRQGLAVDAYVESKLDAQVQAPSLARFLSRTNPAVPEAQILKDTERFIREELAASYYYLTVLVARRSSGFAHSGLRVFDRRRVKTFEELFV